MSLNYLILEDSFQEIHLIVKKYLSEVWFLFLLLSSNQITCHIFIKMQTEVISESQFLGSLLSSLYPDSFFKISTMLLASGGNMSYFKRLDQLPFTWVSASSLESKDPDNHFPAISLEVSGTFPPCQALLSSPVLHLLLS